MKKYRFKIKDRAFDVSVDMQKDDSAVVYINGDRFDIAIESDNEGEPSSETVRDHFETDKKSRNFGTESSAILSPIPGILLDLRVKVGDNVRKGQILAVVEAMKMENDIVSEQEGVVRSVSASVGDTLMEGSTIMVIEKQ